MIVDELVTVLKYKLENSRDMKVFMNAAQNLRKTTEGVNRELNRKVRAGWLKDAIDSAHKLNKKFGRGTTELEKMQRAARKAGASISDLEGSFADQAGKLRRANGQFLSVNGKTFGPGSALQKGIQDDMHAFGNLRFAILGVASALTSLNIAKAMDTSASIDGRLKLSADAGNVDSVRKQLYKNSIESGTSIDSNVDLFSTVARNKASLGMDDADAVKLSNIVAKAVALTGGKDAGTDAAAITQFGQSLGAGTLQGDELRSILENSGGLAQAIADSFGVSVAELKELGSQGKLTSKVMAKGLLKQAEKINKQFEMIPKKFSQGMTNLGTVMVERVAKPLNEMTDLGERFFQLTQYISDNFEEVATKVGAAGIVGSLMTAVKYAEKLRHFLKMGAIFYGFYLVAEDILIWIQGGQSMLGQWLGTFDAITEKIKSWAAPIGDFLDTLADSGAEIEVIIAGVGLLSAAIYLLTSPVLLVVAGITLISTAIATAIYGVQELKKRWRGWADDMGIDPDQVEAPFKVLGGFSDIFQNAIRGNLDGVRAAMDEITGVIKGQLGTAADGAEKLWKGTIDAISGLFTSLGETIGGAFKTAADAAESAWNGVINWIETKISSVANSLEKIGDFFGITENTKEQVKQANSAMSGGKNDYSNTLRNIGEMTKSGKNPLQTAPVGAVSKNVNSTVNNTQHINQTNHITAPTMEGAAAMIANATTKGAATGFKSAPNVEAL